MDFSTLTQENLDKFKALYPNDKKVQAVTLNELISYSRGKDPNGFDLTLVAQPGAEQLALVALPPCPVAVAVLVINVVLFFIGVPGLAQKIRETRAVARVAEVITPQLVPIEEIARTLGNTATSAKDKALAIFKILKTIWSAGMFSAIMDAFRDNLSVLDFALIGVTALATIVALVATDGLAIAAKIALAITQIGFIVTSAVQVGKDCGST